MGIFVTNGKKGGRGKWGLTQLVSVSTIYYLLRPGANPAISYNHGGGGLCWIKGKLTGMAVRTGL